MVALSACASPAARIPPPREPPPRVVVATFERVSLRATSWTTLHTLLAARAKGVPELESSMLDYEAALAGDTDHAAFARSEAALETCTTEACARDTLAGSPFAKPLSDAHASFVARRWGDAVESELRAVEAARGAFGPEADAILDRVAHDLGIDWPPAPVTIAIVDQAPSPPGRALLPVALAARGGCFVTLSRDGKEEDRRVHDARIVDCVVTRAILALTSKSRLRAALPNGGAGDRAFTLVVVHAVAATVTGWERRHASAYRQSAAAVEPDALAWLAEHWRERANGEPIGASERSERESGIAAWTARYAAELAHLDAAAAARE
jgi:hypothetical protein